MAAQFSEPSPRSDHLSAAVEGKFCVWGGFTNNWEERDRLISTFHSFDPLKETWTSKSCSGLRRGHHGIFNCASASAGRFIYMYGGDDGVKWHSSLYRLNTRSGKWKELCGTGPMVKVDCSMVATFEKLVLFGGCGFSSGPPQPGAKFVRSKNIPDGRGWTNELHIFDLKKGIIFQLSFCLFVVLGGCSPSIHVVSCLMHALREMVLPSNHWEKTSSL